MPDLVAIDLPGGDGFVTALRRVWDRGDAALPVDPRLPAPALATLLGALRPTRWLDASGERAHDGDPVEPGDALVMPTSGSTGVPKGVVLTHAAIAASAAASSARLGVTSADVWLACLPLSHVGGLSVVTRALHTGAGLVVHDGFDAELAEQAARQGATAVSLVATALARVDAALFRVIVLGGSRPPPDRPANVHATYGLTETGSGVVYDGRPLDRVEVAVDEDGEVLVRAPMLMRCYRDGTTTIDDEGWLHTGDLGGWNPDGTLHVDGRRGDMIVSGGENVWPDPVEAVIAAHPGVAEVAVAGVTDPEWGQRVVAWVVPRGEAPTLQQVRALVTDALPAYCAPKELYLVTALPKTSLGKMQRHRLVVPPPT